MGIVDVAKDALKEIPLSEVLRERVSLALDRLSEAESKIETLQMENGGLKAQLERERLDHEQTKEKLQRLEEQLREEIRLVHDVEYRRGARTNDEWKPFCPKCHLPIAVSAKQAGYPRCNDIKCGWISSRECHVVAVDALGLPVRP